MKLVTGTALATLAIDQLTKTVVLHVLDLASRQRIDVLPPFLNLRMAWNQGINFGLFSNTADAARWALIALSLAISLWIWLWVRREPHRRITKVSAGLLIGGALGNVVDRIYYGAVADFLNMSVLGFENPYSFNVADITIFAGAIGLVIFTGPEKTP